MHGHGIFKNTRDRLSLPIIFPAAVLKKEITVVTQSK
jgi:hypothetical protein